MARCGVITILLLVSLTAGQEIVTEIQIQTWLADLKAGVNIEGAASLLSSAGGAALPGLLEIARDRKAEPEVRRRALDVIGQIKDPGVGLELLPLVRDAPAAVRISAMQALGALGSREAVEPLTEALRDRHEAVRSEAAAALGRIKDARAVMPLVVAAQDEVFTVRAKVMWALGELAGRDGLPVVIAGLRDSAASVRANAARALGTVGDTAHVYYLEPLLADDDHYVRELTVQGLGRLGGGPAVNLVIRQAHDASANVRRSVIAILEHLGQDSGSAVILQACSDPETLVANQARTAARGLSTDRLLQALKDSAVGSSGKRIALDLIVARTDKDSAGRLITAAIPEWNPNHVRAVIENTVIEGMNRDQVRLAMGDPASWQVFPEGDERWIYSTFSFMIVIKNGVVTGLEPKPGP